jgi:hypothetical protein
MAVLLAFCCVCAGAETATEESEQGLEEIQTLLDISEVEDTEGMGLEEMTEAVIDSAMSEYIDTATGFSMQYPSSFLFDEGENSSFAVNADRTASLYIENIVNEGTLTEEILIEAIRLEIPEAEMQKNEQNGCLRFDRTEDNGNACQTDLYLLTKRSLHHIIIRYPAEKTEMFETYISFMINTMETDDTDLG